MWYLIGLPFSAWTKWRFPSGRGSLTLTLITPTASTWQLLTFRFTRRIVTRSGNERTSSSGRCPHGFAARTVMTRPFGLTFTGKTIGASRGGAAKSAPGPPQAEIASARTPAAIGTRIERKMPPNRSHASHDLSERTWSLSRPTHCATTAASSEVPRVTCTRPCTCPSPTRLQSTWPCSHQCSPAAGLRWTETYGHRSTGNAWRSGAAPLRKL